MRTALALGLILAATATAPAARAECLDWDAEDVEIRSGAVGDGAVYLQASRPAGFGHFHQALAIAWTDAAGAPRRQTLYDRLGSERFAEPRAVRDGLAVRATECEFRGVCRAREDTWTRTAGAAAYTGWSAWANVVHDPDDERRYASPAPPARPADASDCPPDAPFARFFPQRPRMR
ncbi:MULTISPECIES: hypothetical protein [Luteimonas]|uniref:hypothetical protein n=1 Tax=Luteimonas TaxID=83614 RepID=UPI00046588B9|nr:MULTISPECIES: hypothetical protein [Luteimonas]